MAELRNPTATRWDWDRILAEQFAAPPFPRGITHGDVDAEIEINGYFLVLEGKRVGEELSDGQRYTMEARVRDGRTCVIVYGDPDTDEICYMQVWPHAPQPATWSDFYALEVSWARQAECSPRAPSRYSHFEFPGYDEFIPQEMIPR